MLSGNENRINTNRLAVLVRQCDLSLSIGTQTGGDFVMADVSQALRQLVRQPNRGRHQIGCISAGITKHDSLVASALTITDITCTTFTLFKRVVHSPGNIRALLSNRNRYATRGTVKAHL